MNNSQALVKSPIDMIPFTIGDIITRQEVDLVKSLIAPDATDQELAGFILTCNARGLNPFKKQIFAVRFKNPDTGKSELSTLTSIDGLRALAERSKMYDGQDPPQWCGADAVWKDIWLGADPPMAARVNVYRKGQSRPVVGVALWREYVKYTSDGRTPRRFWRDMPAAQLAKCAEAQALRRACPVETSGIGLDEEMMPASRVMDITPIDGDQAMKDLETFFDETPRGFDTQSHEASRKASPAAAPDPPAPAPTSAGHPVSRGPETVDARLASAAQVNLITRLSQRAGVKDEDIPAWVEQTFGAAPHKLTKQQASDVITKLKDLPTGGAKPPATADAEQAIML